VIRAVNLKKRYGKKEALKGIDIQVKKGEIVGLLGPNGAGKTTTFKIILGEIDPDGGRVFLDERDITYYPMWRRVRLGIGYLPQRPSVFRGLTVEDNIRAYLEFRPLPRRQRRRILNLVLEEMGIAHLRHRKALHLSGGERRKLEVARALSLEPQFMLLDEPFTGIDPISIKEMTRIILKLQRWNLGIVITDHNVRETLKITHRAYIINKGRILSAGSPREIYRDPEVREKFLGEEFSLEDEEQKST